MFLIETADADYSQFTIDVGAEEGFPAPLRKAIIGLVCPVSEACCFFYKFRGLISPQGVRPHTLRSPSNW